MFDSGSKTENLFKIASYGSFLCGLFALYFSNGNGITELIFFLTVSAIAWFIENTNYQLTDKVGLLLIVILIPFFYLDWKFRFSGYTARATFVGGNLSRILLILGSIKLLQKKKNRDWVYVYIIALFEILLAAGIGVSGLFPVFLVLYMLCAFSAIILFEIKKSIDKIKSVKRLYSASVKPNSSIAQEKQLIKLPAASLLLLAIISIFAVPLFFAFPRVGGAGFGSSLSGVGSFTGFSDSVRLGSIGKLQQNDEIVMRVKVDEEQSLQGKPIRWRGVALDNFESQTWSKSRYTVPEILIKGDRDFFLVDSSRQPKELITQTVYLEPIDTPILFGLSGAVAVQGNFQALTKDSEGSLTFPRNGWERLSYKIYSDLRQPDEAALRKDSQKYLPEFQKYLQLPKKLDPRISELAQTIISDSGADNTYDKAKTIENYLQTKFGYSLEMKAGGADPLADFLFNVREGHCEYFASSMAIMLRTQGIATRVVNGFQRGEYNETAGVFVVKQKDAHSWVEVYFPHEKAWVAFDPTPVAGQPAFAESSSLTDTFKRYLETVESFWIQYVVSFDNQEQKSLFRSVRNNLSEKRENLSDSLNKVREDFTQWWNTIRGDRGISESIKALLSAVAYIIGLIFVFLAAFFGIKKIRGLRFWEILKNRLSRNRQISVIEFYERMQNALAKNGFRRTPHQTPLEFAFALEMPEAVKITEKYNRVRFGEKDLTHKEVSEIESWLTKLENNSEIQKDL